MGTSLPSVSVFTCFFHTFNQYLLSAYCSPSLAVQSEGTAVNVRNEVLAFTELTIWIWKDKKTILLRSVIKRHSR